MDFAALVVRPCDFLRTDQQSALDWHNSVSRPSPDDPAIQMCTWYGGPGIASIAGRPAPFDPALFARRTGAAKTAVAGRTAYAYTRGTGSFLVVALGTGRSLLVTITTVSSPAGDDTVGVAKDLASAVLDNLAG